MSHSHFLKIQDQKLRSFKSSNCGFSNYNCNHSLKTVQIKTIYHFAIKLAKFTNNIQSWNSGKIIGIPFYIVMFSRDFKMYISFYLPTLSLLRWQHIVWGSTESLYIRQSWVQILLRWECLSKEVLPFMGYVSLTKFVFSLSISFFHLRTGDIT